MTEVYNWHIENGVRASELHPISCDDMQLRFNMVKDSRMPFIVAVEKSGSARQRKTRRVYGMNHHGDYNDPDNTTLTKEEHVIGWASATEWSCADYVECISAEVELYVAHDFRQKGVGRALMDVLLDATDSGHTKVGNYDFRVAPEIAHKYNGGGIRNLHKIIFTVRAWNKPMAPENCYRTYKTTTRANLDKWSNWNAAPDAGASHHHITNPIKDFSKEARLSDREDDYSVWLKEWLESYGFEEEGGFKKIGTRNRRFIDIHYFTKETHWQPVENQMEDYSIGPV
jgi:L-amino acid N-acyltransferase YncA